jgi:hypothetical protein
VVVTLHPNARPGNTNALKNGARSPARIAAKARAHRRRFLRRAGIRAGDLDAVALELLNLYARSSLSWICARPSAAAASTVRSAVARSLSDARFLCPYLLAAIPRRSLVAGLTERA